MKTIFIFFVVNPGSSGIDTRGFPPPESHQSSPAQTLNTTTARNRKKFHIAFNIVNVRAKVLYEHQVYFFIIILAVNDSDVISTPVTNKVGRFPPAFCLTPL